jgi:hypothetical protein
MPSVARSVARNVAAAAPASGALPRRRIRWRTCYRVIPSRFPPIDLFERVADPADLDAVIALESLTNDRLRDEAGDISLVPAGERVAGPGAGYIMAAFTHTHPAGGRFSDARHGAYYAARLLATAVAESSHHRAAFLRATGEPPMQLDMRVLEAELDGRLHDLRGLQVSVAAVYAPNDYSASQALARRLRGDGSDGVAYDSVRHAGGQCVAIFRPRRLRHCRATLHITYVWDGSEIVDAYEKRPLD